MVTVLVATRNRAQIFRTVLEAYTRVESPSGGWKLVVVDNGSTDETPRLLREYQDRLPLTGIRESNPGKNHALNAALPLIEGDLAVFSDDDAFPRPDWLIEWRAAADTHPEYSVFGGAVAARWEAPPPRWVEWVRKGPVFSLTDPAQAEGPIDPAWIFGPNMAIRASIFQSGIRYDPSIGPNGSNYAMGSETELLLRLGRLGHRSWFVRSAQVEHFIGLDHLDENWVIQRAFRFGRGFYRLFYASGVYDDRLWFGVPRHFFRDIPKTRLRAIISTILRNKEAAFRARWDYQFLRGQAREARAIAGGRSARTRASALAAPGTTPPVAGR